MQEKFQRNIQNLKDIKYKSKSELKIPVLLKNDALIDS